jgi:hypothetical protein
VVEVGDVVVVVEQSGSVVVVVLVVASVAASTSSCWAIAKPAVTMAGVAGAAPSPEMSLWPAVPRTKRMNWANAVALSAGRPFVGTTK